MNLCLNFNLNLAALKYRNILTDSESPIKSITINLPWCITFQFKDGEFLDVKIENYHRG